MAALSNQEQLEQRIIEETEVLDFVSSWSNLHTTYEQLGFTDVIPDNERIKEYQWIISQMNRHLGRMRSALLPIKEASDALDYMREHMKPKGVIDITDRKSLAYQTLRQAWMARMAMAFSEMVAEQREENDGWNY